MSSPVLSILIPIFNEAEGLPSLIARIMPVVERIEPSFEICFVNDGSRDTSLEVLHFLVKKHPRIKALSLSRNFGKEIAIAAGLDHVRGQAVVIMDADLQHPPELIADFVQKWREGYANIYGVRQDRMQESAFRRTFTHGFYKLFANFSETDLPEGAGDFRLLDRKVIDALRSLGERARFSKGLYAWVGFRSIGIPFDVAERMHGRSKWSFRKLLRFALDGLTSFSTVPLRIWSYIGLLISGLAFSYALFVLMSTLLYGVDVPGFPSLIISVMFFSGIQLLSLGILGEYIGRIFAEVKRRPLYIVEEYITSKDETILPPQEAGSNLSANKEHD